MDCSSFQSKNAPLLGKHEQIKPLFFLEQICIISYNVNESRIVVYSISSESELVIAILLLYYRTN